MPLAAFATLDRGELTIDAAWGDPDGILELVSVRASAVTSGRDGAAALGSGAAAQLRAAVTARGGSVPEPAVPPANS